MPCPQMKYYFFPIITSFGSPKNIHSQHVSAIQASQNPMRYGSCTKIRNRIQNCLNCFTDFRYTIRFMTLFHIYTSCSQEILKHSRETFVTGRSIHATLVPTLRNIFYGFYLTEKVRVFSQVHHRNRTAHTYNAIAKARNV